MGERLMLSIYPRTASPRGPETQATNT
ncbi:hypothetical protein CTAM01_00910 [Colletotrichum tamarilloi]|uniref:Uncharacterized protein n=1 Tax=Colletotrichum tamarilloi TaxID=1209934 RepID=A0ABQ9RSJ0_9PEZI|nr:hypothetical protein CSPX01_06609 [Colletotrichum filicis]KAK1511980.1 hypothetical protein CTAM01_00910 [Colletotrichum tamarilloi]